MEDQIVNEVVLGRKSIAFVRTWCKKFENRWSKTQTSIINVKKISFSKSIL